MPIRISLEQFDYSEDRMPEVYNFHKSVTLSDNRENDLQKERLHKEFGRLLDSYEKLIIDKD